LFYHWSRNNLYSTLLSLGRFFFQIIFKLWRNYMQCFKKKRGEGKEQKTKLLEVVSTTLGY
jgi:hypothetical protein